MGCGVDDSEGVWEGVRELLRGDLNCCEESWMDRREVRMLYLCGSGVGETPAVPGEKPGHGSVFNTLGVPFYIYLIEIKCKKS